MRTRTTALLLSPTKDLNTANNPDLCLSFSSAVKLLSVLLNIPIHFYQINIARFRKIAN